VIDEDAAQRTVTRTLARWLILGVVILLVRFLRWGGILGLIGIGTVASTIWLAFQLADPDTGELTGPEGAAVLVVMIAGIGLYVIGVRRRRRSAQSLSSDASTPIRYEH
jgi:hypothetical protein